MTAKLILALDSGTSVVKAVAFDADGGTFATVARPNRFAVGRDGAVEQDMARSWDDARAVLRELAERCAGREIAALAVTGQGDGTWLVDEAGDPAAPAWLWLDARAAGIVEHLRENGAAQAAFAFTGTGIAACQQAPQLLWLRRHRPELLARAATALHCKDWLYLKLTGVRATDPSEACFTFGSWRTRTYREEVLEALGMPELARLLPPIVDGTRQSHPLSPAAAAAIGLPAGLPVVLGAVDMGCVALGAGLFGAGEHAGVSILGSTGVHMRLLSDPDLVAPSPSLTGYCMVFPVDGHTMQAQTNMAATLNIDWAAGLVAQAAALAGSAANGAHLDVIRALDAAVAGARPGALVFHPFISSAGERGPFTDSFARAGMFGLDQSVGFAELVRGVYEGLGLAARDCYAAMGGVPAEVRVSGGASRSAPMRAILAACLDRPVRIAAQPEAGAAGAAMMAAVRIGAFADMRACAARWVAPLLGAAEAPDPELARAYDRLFPIYRDAYNAMPGLWRRLHAAREGFHAA